MPDYPQSPARLMNTALAISSTEYYRICVFGYSQVRELSSCFLLARAIFQLMIISGDANILKRT